MIWQWQDGQGVTDIGKYNIKYLPIWLLDKNMKKSQIKKKKNISKKVNEYFLDKNIKM